MPREMRDITMAERLAIVNSIILMNIAKNKFWDMF